MKSISTSSHEEWLELRSKGLGGSDIGTALGFNPFKSPYQLWLEKIGQLEPKDISDKVAIQVGNELEDLVAKMFTQQTGIKVQKDNKTYFHKDYPFLLANIDRKVVGQKALLECKTAGVRSAKDWKGDEIPASYLLQVQHYLNVLDYDEAYIAVIIGNSDFIWKKIERDQNLIDMYTAKAVEFWEKNVIGLVEPELDGSIVTKEAINELYEEEHIESAVLTMGQKELLEEILSLKEDKSTIQRIIEEKENKLKAMMGKQEVGMLYNDEFQATWKTSVRNSLDSQKLKTELPDVYEKYLKQTQYRTLRIKERM